MLLLPGLTQYFGGFRSFYFVFLLLLESAINIFKIVSLWRLYLSAKNEITELKILHVEIKTFWSITPCLLKSTLLNAILNTKLNKFIWKWVFVWKTYRNVYFTCFYFKKYSLKSYPIHVMSLSQSPRSESYSIYRGGPNAEIFLSNLRKRSVKNISYKILIKRVLNK